VVAVIVSTLCYLHFVSYTSMLSAFSTVSLHWRRSGSSVLSRVCSLGAGNISCSVGDVACGVSGGNCWRVGYNIGSRVGSMINYSIGSGIGRLHHFVFTSSLFSYWLKGTMAAMSLARMFQSTPGVGTCSRSAVSRASFFNLSGGDADVSLETLYRRGVLKFT
jgi:hypothetical protein